MHPIPLELDDDNPHALRKFFFRDRVTMETPAEVVQWWEKRRIAYNAVVGAAGVGTIATVNIVGLVSGEPNMIGFPIEGAILYGLLANFCYTAGWFTELLLRPIFRDRTGTVGATLFRYGLAFSVGLTALPIPIVALGAFLNWIKPGFF